MQLGFRAFLRCLLLVGLGGVCSVELVKAQTIAPLDVEFIVNGERLKHALAGGLNAPQLSNVDLNADGIEDLYLFDREGSVHLTFLSDGTNYRYAPEYEANFPKLNYWVLLRDYNADGILDIFTASTVPGIDGVEVYRGSYIDDKLAFEQYQFPESQPFNLIYFPLSSGRETQLFVSRVDYPAVDDIDGDGDLDVLTFNSNGGYVELYANQAVEMGLDEEALVYHLVDDCWGGFYESGLTPSVDLASRIGECFRNLIEEEVGPRHAGSTILTLDMDGDCDKEAILGDLSFENLVFLHNEGTCERAWIDRQDIDFPSYDQPARTAIFPAAFEVDLNQDGLKDLAVAPNNEVSSEDIEVLWWYQNVGTAESPIFNFQQKSFLVEDMLDFGSGAHPTFVDYNADGLLDLVIGNGGRFQLGDLPLSQLFLFENKGTSTEPKFELVDENYLNFQRFSSASGIFAPTFGDLDNDGDLDALVGERDGRLFFLENTAGANQPLAFGAPQLGYMNIDIGAASMPLILDITGDDLPDLLVAERDGNVNFFPNIGTASRPQFASDHKTEPNIQRFGGIDTRNPGDFLGYSSIATVELNGVHHLLAGGESGEIERYLLPINTAITEDLVLEGGRYSTIDVGARARVAVADIDNNNYLDLLVGNERGGLTWYNTDIRLDSMTATEDLLPNAKANIYPNPAREELTITLPNSQYEQLQLFDLSGKLLQQQTITKTQIALQVSELPKGLYFLQLSSATQTEQHRIIIN